MAFVNKKALMRTFHNNIFDYRITFVNSQHENTNKKVILYLKPGFKRSF